MAAPVLLQVRGATTHYDAVVSAATSGVLNASTDTGALTAAADLHALEHAEGLDAVQQQARSGRATAVV
jgi:6,7-dimethyl-8-ribityllumazine synthase